MVCNWFQNFSKRCTTSINSECSGYPDEATTLEIHTFHDLSDHKETLEHKKSVCKMRLHKIDQKKI